MKRLSAVVAILTLTACGSTDTVDGLSRVVDPPPEASLKDPETESDAQMMRGHFTYMADAGIFADCATGRKYPVALEADFIGLERAYLDAVSEGGQPLLVSFEGSVADRPAMEGDEEKATVVVNRFVGVHPGGSCAADKPDAALTNTRWVVTSIRSTKVYVGAGRREPFILFEPETNNIRGFAGCNQLMGSFAVDGSKLTFGTLSTTKMYCAETMKVEDSLLVALRTVSDFEIAGDTLTLLDAKGRTIRLEARSLE